MSYFNIGPGLRQSICNRLDFGGAITWATDLRPLGPALVPLRGAVPVLIELSSRNRSALPELGDRETKLARHGEHEEVTLLVFVSFFLGSRTICRGSSRPSWPKGGAQVASVCSAFHDAAGPSPLQGAWPMRRGNRLSISGHSTRRLIVLIMPPQRLGFRFGFWVKTGYAARKAT